MALQGQAIKALSFMVWFCLAFLHSLPVSATSWNTGFETPRVLIACEKPESNLLSTTLTRDHWAEFVDRDLILLEVIGEEIFLRSSPEGTLRLNAESVKTIQSYNACQSDVSYMLVGKDGGVKNRWNDSLPLEDLFATIDSMPMRRHEMRQKADRN